MIDREYPYGEHFQLKLALLLRDPKKALGVVEPQFFSNPMMVDISRIIRDAYRDHGDGSIKLSKPTLKELVRASLGKRKHEVWVPTEK